MDDSCVIKICRVIWGIQVCRFACMIRSYDFSDFLICHLEIRLVLAMLGVREDRITLLKDCSCKVANEMIQAVGVLLGTVTLGAKCQTE